MQALKRCLIHIGFCIHYLCHFNHHHRDHRRRRHRHRIIIVIVIISFVIFIISKKVRAFARYVRNNDESLPNIS